MLFTSTQAQNLYFPPKTGNEWETISPGLLNWDVAQMDTLIQFAGEHKTKALIILIDGRIALEHYYGTFNADSIWYWASAGKGITAFLTGIAQEQKLLSIEDKTSKFIGEGWSNLLPQQEERISIKNHLTMTTGLDDNTSDFYCTLKQCLVYKADPGTRWAYHNAPYTLLESILSKASGISFNEYTQKNLKLQTGITGLWIKSGFNNIYVSSARSMARFGLLMLNHGVWNTDTLLHDKDYFHKMISSSQELNPAYGYLWWLNGKSFYLQPRLQWKFDGWIVPSAPSDMYAALGKNDQKIYIVPSKNMVVVRMGEMADSATLALSAFDEALWRHISLLEKKSIVYNTCYKPFKYTIKDKSLVMLTPQIYTDCQATVFAINGQIIFRGEASETINLTHAPEGIYFLRITTKEKRIAVFEKFRL